jgi:V/A-type H+-transporting ATPase subunit E
LNKFIDAVLKDANEQRERLLKEIEEEKQRELEKAENDILKNIYAHIQAEIAEIKHQSGRDLSKKALEIRKELLQKRDELSEKIFAMITERLTAFIQTEDYKNYLSSCIQKSISLVGNCKVIFYTCAKDTELVKALYKDLNCNAEIEIDEEIKLGGFILICNEKGIRMNETLDERFNEQKGHFNEISGLVIS